MELVPRILWESQQTWMSYLCLDVIGMIRLYLWRKDCLLQITSILQWSPRSYFSFLSPSLVQQIDLYFRPIHFLQGRHFDHPGPPTSFFALTADNRLLTPEGKIQSFCGTRSAWLSVSSIDGVSEIHSLAKDQYLLVYPKEGLVLWNESTGERQWITGDLTTDIRPGTICPGSRRSIYYQRENGHLMYRPTRSPGRHSAKVLGHLGLITSMCYHSRSKSLFLVEEGKTRLHQYFLRTGQLIYYASSVPIWGVAIDPVTQLIYYHSLRSIYSLAGVFLVSFDQSIWNFQIASSGHLILQMSDRSIRICR